MLEEILSEKLVAEIQQKTKEIHKLTKKNLKDYKKIAECLDTFYKDLDKAKLKYQRSFIDWEDAKEDHLKAEKEGVLSRKDVCKLKATSDSCSNQLEHYKGLYASQLIKTNEAHNSYYHTMLPELLNNLEQIEWDQIDFQKDILKRAIDAEEDASKIKGKCRIDMIKAVDEIIPQRDCLIFTDEYASFILKRP